MTIVRMLVAMSALVALAACERPEPRTVQEFMADDVALTGTLVRCQEMGSGSMQDPECQNARRASERLAALDEERERAAREAEFERKRAELRERRDREQAAREAAAAAARVQEEQALLGTMTFADKASEGMASGTPAGDAGGMAGVSDPTPGDESATAAAAAEAPRQPAAPAGGEAASDPPGAASEPDRPTDPVPED